MAPVTIDALYPETDCITNTDHCVTILVSLDTSCSPSPLSYTPYDGGDDGGESTSKPSVSPHQNTSSTTATVPRRSIDLCSIRAFLHTIPYDGGESTSKPPVSPHQNTSSTTATVPRRSIAELRCIRRLHTCANRKLRSSKLFAPSEPSYTPYHMMAESRPLYLSMNKKLRRSGTFLHTL